MIRKILSSLYIVVIALMAIATILEKCYGTKFVAHHIYSVWWFSALWAMLALTATYCLIQRKAFGWFTIILHTSFLIILLGAFLTHVWGNRATTNLRYGDVQTTCYIQATDGNTKEVILPFKLQLNRFDVSYHKGTNTPADYTSHFSIIDGSRTETAVVSMNNVYSYRGYRFYQTSYDPDMRGSTLTIVSDPYGIGVTYCGYALLFLSLILMLIVPHGRFRTLLRKVAQQPALMILFAMLLASTKLSAATTLPRNTAEEFGKLYVVYNGRVCQMQTFAIDFTKKLYGKPYYKEYSAEQVLAGFMFWTNEWSNEPLLKLKSGDLRSQLDLPKNAKVNTFFNETMGGYILGEYVEQYYAGQQDAFHKQAIDIDDKLMLVMAVQHLDNPILFPALSTKDGLSQQTMISQCLRLMAEKAPKGDTDGMGYIIQKLQKYQLQQDKGTLPSHTKTTAERLYNAHSYTSILFMLCLTIGFLLLFYQIYAMVSGGKVKHANWVNGVSLIIFAAAFTTLTYCLALRWIISGNIPMGNGYETMLAVAWFVMVLTLVSYRRFRIMLTFGFLLAGFCLLVSNISQMNPQITPLMPVLASPLLSVHVSVIMLAYALLSVTFICAITALIVALIGRCRNTSAQEPIERLHLLSQLFLYPAVSFLGIGIFVGAIWANVSWGTYWSWDAKETWALITFMIYGIALHADLVPQLKRPLTYHVFMLLAFMAILMTYFGVNYFLGGMHSYA